MCFLAALSRQTLLADQGVTIEPGGRLLAAIGLFLMLMVAGIIVNAVYRPNLRSRADAWRRGEHWLLERPWRWPVAAVIGAVLLSLQVLAAGLARCAEAPGWMADMDAELCHAFLQGISFHVTALLLILAYLWRRRVSPAAAFGVSSAGIRRKIGQGVLYYLGALPLIFLASLAYDALLSWLGWPIDFQDVILIFIKPQSWWSMALLLLLALAIAPIAEETLFRGLLLPLLARSLGVVPAVLLTAVCFALIHFHVPSFVPIFVLAVAMADAYICTRSLIAPIVMHALFNGINLALLTLIEPQ